MQVLWSQWPVLSQMTPRTAPSSMAMRSCCQLPPAAKVQKQPMKMPGQKSNSFRPDRTTMTKVTMVHQMPQSLKAGINAASRKLSAPQRTPAVLVQTVFRRPALPCFPVEK